VAEGKTAAAKSGRVDRAGLSAKPVPDGRPGGGCGTGIGSGTKAVGAATWETHFGMPNEQFPRLKKVNTVLFRLQPNQT